MQMGDIRLPIVKNTSPSLSYLFEISTNNALGLNVKCLSTFHSVKHFVLLCLHIVLLPRLGCFGVHKELDFLICYG